MKKLLLFILSLCSIMVYGQKDYSVSFEQTKGDVYQLNFDVTRWNLQTKTFDGATYQIIDFSQSTVTEEKGWAELPFVSASVQLPARKNVDLNIDYTEYQDIQLEYPLLPSRGVIYRNQDPASIPYEIDPKSIEDKFYPENIAFSEEPFILRDVRGTTVRVFPFQWNAATKTLRIYNKITVSLVENNQSATNPLLKENPNPIYEARGMYKSIFINYVEPKLDIEIGAYGDILVVTTARDEAAIEPYIIWKKEKGYNVAKEIVTAGTNVKTLIKQKYDDNEDLMYVLLVGDWADIKCDVYTGAPTDPMLGDVIGPATDYRPEIAIGRMSASNPAQVTIQVNKAIQYEKNPNMEAGWYESFIGIASNEGAGNGDDGEIDYTHIQRIYTERLESPKFTYNAHRQNYAPGASAATLAGHINTGASTIAYCGHGSETTFVTTGFSNSNVNQLTNGQKLPFIVSVACVNGAFHNSSDCFAEAWLKKENGGAVVTWMSTINQPWTPPQRGQDYFYDILIGGFDYTQYSGQNGINTNEQRTNWGSIVVNAANLMLSENSSSSDKETVRTWCTFGDPALQLRTALPKTIVSSQSMILVGSNFETTITADGALVANALVCLSQNNVYEKGFTNVQGQVSIPNSFTPGDVHLVVTGFNTTTIYEDIPCIAPQGPYLAFDAVEVNDSNGQLDYYDESVKLNFTMKNVGNDAASNVTVTITSEDPMVNIIDGTATLATIAAHGTATINDAFEIAVLPGVSDQHDINFAVTATGSATWESSFSITANSTNPEITKIAVNDVVTNNVMANELSFITLTVTNNGHSDASTLNGELSTANSNITIAYNLADIGNLAVGESKDISFIIVTSATLPAGNDIVFDLKVTGNYDYITHVPFSLTSNDYCVPGATSCTGGDKLTYVKFSNIENSNTSCGANGYSDYTSMEANLTPGGTYSIEVKCGYNNNFVKGWFDFNGDKTFDANEAMFTINCASTSQSYSASFTVPMDAKPGKSRIRLRVQYNSSPTGPCDAWQYGQTHDYTMVIPELFPKIENLIVTQDYTGISISWEEPQISREDLVLKGYNIYRNSERMNTTPIIDKEFHDTDIPEGAFIYKIYAVYEKGTSLSVMSDLFLIKGKPSELQATASEIAYSIALTWTEPHSEASGYNIYRDGELLTTTTTGTTYIDEGLEKDTEYCYFVAAIFDDVESEATEEVCEKTAVSVVGICNVTLNNAFKIHPNPAHSSVQLTADILPTQVQLFNVTGQLVYRTIVCDKIMTISLEALPSGIYFIKINSAQGSTTKKVIVQ